MTAKAGYLEVIMGPMFSGKTTYLMNIYDECQSNGDKVLVINYAKDTRYHDTMLSTHDKRMCPSLFVESLLELVSSFTGAQHLIPCADIILINEGQFFTDIYDAVIYMVEVLKKRVYVCGLDGDFKRHKFGGLLDLVPVCDSIIKLKSKCSCGEEAIFSHRMVDNGEQVLIGSDIYVPLCRTCYLLEQ